MKKIQLFSLALAAGLLMSCSDSVEQVNNPGTGEAVDGYLGFNISMPTSGNPGSRAMEGYVPGESSEFAVYNGKLLLFSGATEAEACYVGTYDLNGMNWVDHEETDQVTQESQAWAEVSGIANTSSLWGLVVLNDNGQLPASIADGTKLSELAALTGKTADDFTGAGFFMSNSPLSTATGAAAAENTMFTLAKFDANPIKTSLTEALNNPAADVYVERAVAKVQVNNSGSSVVAGGNAKIASYQLNGWVLDNTNKSTYWVRNIAGIGNNWWGLQAEGVTGYRFIDANVVNAATDADPVYRIHFAADPNYSSAIAAGDVDRLATLPESWLTAGAYDYCLENTFDVAHMTWPNTTRVIVKATLTLAGQENPCDIYVVNNDNNNPYVTKDDAAKAVASIAMNYLNTNKSQYIKDGTISGATVTLSANAANGYFTVTGVAITESGTVTYAGELTKEAVEAALLQHVASVPVAFYEGGASYYSIRIKHFGDEETPWSEADATADGSYGNASSATAASDFLGRYGVVRNTWYVIDVQGIREFGSPSVPDLENKWDDEVNYYIAVNIYTQDWAKRKQGAVLE